MAEITRLSECSEWIDLDFVERERIPRRLMELGIRLHLAGLSLLNTVSEIEKFGVQRSRKAVHDWILKADLQPTGDQTPTQVAVDETVIRINDQQYWLYAAANPRTNELLHVRLFLTTIAALTDIFLRELWEKHTVDDALFLVDDAPHLKAALHRAGLRFQVDRHGNWNAIERVLREVKRRTSSFSTASAMLNQPPPKPDYEPSPSGGTRLTKPIKQWERRWFG
jgi:putative transposase